jgi:hypothetical protein
MERAVFLPTSGFFLRRARQIERAPRIDGRDERTTAALV